MICKESLYVRGELVMLSYTDSSVFVEDNSDESICLPRIELEQMLKNLSPGSRLDFDNSPNLVPIPGTGHYAHPNKDLTELLVKGYNITYKVPISILKEALEKDGDYEYREEHFY